MHGKGAIIEEVLDWRPCDYFTHRYTVSTAMGPVRFVATTEFEPTPGGTILHQRFAAPMTPKERHHGADRLLDGGGIADEHNPSD